MAYTYTLWQLPLLFFCYALLGWCLEVSYVAVTAGKIVNRGFLNGPLCPIYGVGMLGTLLLFRNTAPVWLFFGGMALCTGIELVGGWALERFFGMRWWDYTDKPHNLGGYICLQFSLMWGLAVLVAVSFIHPALMGILSILPQRLCLWFLGILTGLFLADLAVTIRAIIGLRRHLHELEQVGQRLRTVSDAMSQWVGTVAINADSRLEDLRIEGRHHRDMRKAEYREVLSEYRLSHRELLEKKRQLQLRYQELLAESRSRSKRLRAAFPAIHRSLQERLRDRRDEDRR